MEAKDLTRKRKPYRTRYWRYMDYILKYDGVNRYVVKIDFMTGKVLCLNQKKVK